ncbi:ABC transporter substrate-binding protein [Salinibacterium sp. M195]|uniref:ABC transporter substrate-binding protein n=1 Tax=Salinibacterium sp. M195 TaxID=2583374 RepID=UPI001C63AEA2|nr:ABC transporter substrate-binding protein [Salinibacterium sp. M195]QYH35556.1 ABC transporter substrate-binding protein [Salinibacterium sp. M195]
MKKANHSKLAVVASLAIVPLVLSACAASPDTSNGGGSQTLTVDNSFVLKTLDPGFVYEQTGATIVHVLYDTLVTFDGSDVSEVKPSLAESFEASDDAKEFTFTLRDDVTFADGSALDSEDVVFSLNRLKNLKGSASQIVSGMSFSASDEDTVVVTSDVTNPDVPTILAQPSTGILNSEVAAENGATDAEDAATADSIGTYLDTNSLGSGPYTISSYDPSSKVVLTANPDYWGEAPGYDRVVLQNVDVQNQKLTIAKSSGDEVALDLSGALSADLPDTVQISGVPDTSYFLSLNQDPAVSELTSNRAFVNALRASIDNAGIAKLFGPDATAASGVVPPAFSGALDPSDAPKQDIEAAKKLLADAGISNPSASLVYPAITYRGVDLGTIVTKVQADAKEAGIAIELTPQPINVFLDGQAAGQNEIGFSPNSLNYPVAASLVNNMAPGASTSLRNGWTLERADASAIDASEAVIAATTPEERVSAMQEWQRVMNEVSPFIPMANNSGIVVATENLDGAVYSPAGWTIDLADISSK